ncbi:MAG: DNA recombination protein RmuC [Elusimicrobiota bacterium]|jgi:DNA recombination protein RmuC
MTTALWVVLGALLGAVFAVLAVSLLKRREDSGFAEIFRAATDQFMQAAEGRWQSERARGASELDERRRAVEETVSRLQEKLKDYEGLVRGFEKDREGKYGALEEQLRGAVRANEELRRSTDALRRTLSDSRTRGQWGERMAEDILRLVGFVENVQYVRDTAQETVSTRPDYTFFLPEGHKLNMDVKFPLDNYLRMVDAATDDERERTKTEFLRDVKARIKEIQKREYINPAERTLDYVLLFIPNEQVYAFVLESMPGLMDEALSQRVVLVSPWTLYAVLSVVRRSFENFHFSKSTQETLKLVAAFDQAWSKFKERFLQLGAELDRLGKTYQEITGASFKRLEQAVDRVERARGADGANAEKTDVPA